MPIPPELVDAIVQFAVEDDPLETAFTRQQNLLSFSLVSKIWLAVSAPLLLQHPNFADSDMVEEFTDFCERNPRVRRGIKSMTFRFDKIVDMDKLSFLEDIPHEFYRGVQSASFMYALVSPRYCFVLSLVRETFGANLTTLVLAHVELAAPESLWEVAQFPQLRTLELRHVIVQTADEYFLERLNDRVPDLLLPVGTKRFSPRLSTLHICGSGLGAINLGDFVPIASQITFLSLGVFDDSAFLRPDTLAKFTFLETFEFWWPLYADLPFKKLASDNNITELRIRDRWDRWPRGEWSYGEPNFVDLEWSESGSVVDESEDVVDSEDDVDDSKDNKDASSDVNSQVSSAEDDERDSDDSDHSPHSNLDRLNQVARDLNSALEHDDPPYFPNLERLVLPLKFRRYYPGGERGAILQSLADLDETLDAEGIEVRFEERRWASESARQKLAR
ncbi:hypothetical protein RQP46_004369 [Phenoliferia psychrophenolica]